MPDELAIEEATSALIIAAVGPQVAPVVAARVSTTTRRLILFANEETDHLPSFKIICVKSSLLLLSVWFLTLRRFARPSKRQSEKTNDFSMNRQQRGASSFAHFTTIFHRQRDETLDWTLFSRKSNGLPLLSLETAATSPAQKGEKKKYSRNEK